MNKQPVVYMLANRYRGTIYTGVTGNLAARSFSHRTGAQAGFTEKYGVNRLVWYEFQGTMIEAITREKQIKNWKRDWKIRAIEEFNPDWRDLYGGLNN